MTKQPIEVITSVERRRRRPREDKERLVAACLEPGAVLSEIARAALYYASRDRRQEHPERHLKNFTGILQACPGNGRTSSRSRKRLPHDHIRRPSQDRSR
jgi:transposase-like protein